MDELQWMNTAAGMVRKEEDVGLMDDSYKTAVFFTTHTFLLICITTVELTTCFLHIQEEVIYRK